MLGKIILAAVILLILFIIYSIWHTCHTGKSKGFLTNIFAKVCHVFTG